MTTTILSAHIPAVVGIGILVFMFVWCFAFALTVRYEDRQALRAAGCNIRRSANGWTVYRFDVAVGEFETKAEAFTYCTEGI